MSSDQKVSQKEKEKEDPGLAEFKEVALKNCILEKALSRPEANCCTYSKGYIQQECFICLTCLLETKKRAVLCLGCSIKCHDEHEIVPIGFKRSIRCDCGNNNFFIDCKLKKKDEIDYDNPHNNYNHNMENKYCYCDTEDDGNSTMAQCFFCEDWFHKEHLNIFGVKKSEKKICGDNNNNNNCNNDINDIDCESEDLPLFDLVCKNCVIKIKDILIGYDLNKFLYGLMPEDHIKIIELEDDKETEKKDNKNDGDKKIEIKEDLQKNKSLFVEEEKINSNKSIKNETPLLLGKKREAPFPPLDENPEDKKNEENVKKNKIEETSSSINIINNNINDNNLTKCKRKKYIEHEELLNDIIKKEENILMDCEIFLKLICRCKSCEEMHKKMGLDLLNNKNLFKEWESRKTFDDIINDEKFIEEVEKENPISLDSIEGNINEFFNSKEYKELTCEQQILVRGYISELGNKLQEFISTLNHTTITVEDIYTFINKYRDHFEELKNK